MSNTQTFFDDLTARRQPLLAGLDGTLRFDATHGDTAEYWHLTIRDGVVVVSNQAAAADAVARLDQKLLDEFAAGKANAMAAALRGEVSIEGNPRLLNVFQRLFPGPARGSAT
jgi:alkyl sulfatase BDS1-like metallo-beta-lactamase superfamily hydrolase